MWEHSQSRVLHIGSCEQTCTRTRIHEEMTVPYRTSRLALYGFRKKISLGYPCVLYVTFKMCSLALLDGFAKW
jgi:hypothetical protein